MYQVLNRIPQVTIWSLVVVKNILLDWDTFYTLLVVMKIAYQPVIPFRQFSYHPTPLNFGFLDTQISFREKVILYIPAVYLKNNPTFIFKVVRVFKDEQSQSGVFIGPLCRHF